MALPAVNPCVRVVGRNGVQECVSHKAFVAYVAILCVPMALPIFGCHYKRPFVFYFSAYLPFMLLQPT